MTGKMKLEVDGLNVETFEAKARETARRGTVRGNELIGTVDGTCYDGTCRGYGTCGIYPCRPIP